MIKVFSNEQIRKADEYTIKNEPVLSYDLMEQASKAFVEKFLALFPEKKKVRIFSGVGNNGGDGLAIGRILKENEWEVFNYVVGSLQRGTKDFRQNLDRSDFYAVINAVDDLPAIDEDEIIIDALFGSGLSRPVEGIHKKVIDYLNRQEVVKVSVDIPSGLYSDKPVDKGSTVFRAHYTISFQLPKLAFLIPENHAFVGIWYIVDIGLSKRFIKNESAHFYLTEEKDLKDFVPKRSRFTYKTKVGTLLLVAGSKGKIGASVLAARAAFRTGAGLVNICSPACGIPILQISVPEAIVIDGVGKNYVTKIPAGENTIVIGPGLGTNAKTIAAFEHLLKECKRPIVIDADGINMVAKRRALLKLIPKHSILTPHPGEFIRLVGNWKNDFHKLELLSSFCKGQKLNVVLKGAFSAVCNTKGVVYFNPSGNPVLATAGSGDVLTGIIGAFLANGLEPFEALRLGVYVHGSSGDVLKENKAGLGMMASDIIERIPDALKKLSPKIGI
ncbi:MAG: NAD(P)H-hydrate dehydratase [Ekhidna sp.]|nr:NAD(P)H-hydrate dehydratase [Ekhidna sp.]